ncbi:MAG: TerC family protein [Gammaproteobacteria bacterium]|nr:TerC family protein [Gammaproteobacteria bacterium]
MIIVDVFVTLATLTALEIILGIDNLIFLSILTEKLPVKERQKARYWGLSFAWVSRLFLLAFALALTNMQDTLFTFKDTDFSVRTLFLIIGGFFLIAKATQEIHFEVDPGAMAAQHKSKRYHFWGVVLQVAVMDIVFSIDSVLTAVGLTNEFWIMAAAISIAIIAMIYLSATIAAFIHSHPTIKMLGLCFLLLIGTLLIADGFSFHIPREYLYVVMVFSLGVEGLNYLKKRISRK